MANIYIENRYEDLVKKEKVITLLAARDGNLKERFKEHISKRVDEQYPPSIFDTDQGSVPFAVRDQALAAMDQEPVQLKKTTLHDGKQSIGHDVTQPNIDSVLASVRPSMVVGERDTSAEDPQKLIDKITGIQVRMSTEFEQQFNNEYLSRIFPWALNYSCGGPDYANLFDNWDHLDDENYSSRENAWSRRPPDAPILDAGKFAQMLATRCEAQIASDWMLVPAARNLHWRYTVLHNALCVTKAVRHFES